MKKQFLFYAVATLLSISSLMAQEGKKKTPEEKTKEVMEKLAVLNLDEAARAKTETIFTDFYTAQHKAKKEMRASGTNREAMKAEKQKFANERDAKLKLVFTQEQLKTWINDIEPSLKSPKTVQPAAPATPAPVAAPAN